MTFPKLLSLAISALLFSFFIAPALAQSSGGIDLSSFGELLGEKLGIGDFAGNLLMGFILEFVCLFPLAMISRRKGSSIIIEIALGLGLFAVNIAVGFWPYWMLIVLSMILALMFSGKIRDWLSGE